MKHKNPAGINDVVFIGAYCLECGRAVYALHDVIAHQNAGNDVLEYYDKANHCSNSYDEKFLRDLRITPETFEIPWSRKLSSSFDLESEGDS